MQMVEKTIKVRIDIKAVKTDIILKNHCNWRKESSVLN